MNMANLTLDKEAFVMDIKNSPLFHFIVGTLWFLAAAVTALEHQAFIGNIYWPPIILSIAGVYF